MRLCHQKQHTAAKKENIIGAMHSQYFLKGAAYFVILVNEGTGYFSADDLAENGVLVFIRLLCLLHLVRHFVGVRMRFRTGTRETQLCMMSSTWAEASRVIKKAK